MSKDKTKKRTDNKTEEVCAVESISSADVSGFRMDSNSNIPETGERISKNTLNVWILLGVLVVLGIVVIAGAIHAQLSIPANVGYPLEGEERQAVIDRNSPLTDYVYLTPNATFPREDTIKKITIHHMGGTNTLEKVGSMFQDRDRQASSNYAIDVDGNVALYVEEDNRAWTSSNKNNDHQAITIEVANDVEDKTWHVGDKTYNKLIDLIVDICKRNGIEELNYTGDANGNLTYHQMFNYKTDCPGPYMISKMDDIADEVNKRLKGE